MTSLSSIAGTACWVGIVFVLICIIALLCDGIGALIETLVTSVNFWVFVITFILMLAYCWLQGESNLLKLAFASATIVTIAAYILRKLFGLFTGSSFDF